MSNTPSYRRLAEGSLNGAAIELNHYAGKTTPLEVVAGHAAHAQVLATVAVAQALLEIGDALRAATGAEPAAPPDFGALIREEIQRANLAKGAR